MKKLFFDIETTGLPDRKALWETDYMSFPHIVQLAWKINGVLRSFIIKPEGYTIPEASAAVHGITTERAMAEGVPFGDIISAFISDCSEADRLVGHNIYFDTSVIKANILRAEDKCQSLMVSALDKEKRIDTMRKTASFCAIPFPSGKKGNKFPTLEELYAKLFPGESFAAHDAGKDVEACERCYNRLIELGILTEDERGGE